jgi:Putative Ig domain
MSPIALADARTTNRGYCFCLVVILFLFVPILGAEQIFNSTQNFNESSQDSIVNRLLLVAGFSPATQGQSYTSTIRVQGGASPYRFWIAGGALPSGLSLNSSTGTISGVPVVSGTFSFTVAAVDSRFSYGRQLLQLNVGSNGQSQISIALSPETAQIAPGARLQFAATVRNTAQTGVIWSASAGSISSSGLFTAPARAGSTVITATAAANSGVHASANILVQTSATLTIATSSLMNAQVNSPYSTAIIAQGGSEPYAWSLYSGSLPSGLTLNTTNGVIAGTVSQAGAYTFTTKVTDASAHSSTRQLTLNVTAVTSGNFDGPAELPRVYVQSALANTPAPGNTIKVTAGGSFQSALNNVNCGDTIQLQAGATFTGQFTLANKNCDDNHWIIIRTSAPDSALPSEGTRVSPCYAGVSSLPGRPALNCASTQKVMATLMAQRGWGPLTLAPGANHYRLGPGLEITRPVGTGVNFNLVSKDPTVPADHIILDRDWVHGTARDETTRGLHLNGITYAAVVDSYFSDFHCVAGIGACVDSQAIAGGSGNVTMGTWKIFNNFLEAAAENIIFGGAAGSTTPADIEIRHNHFFKPLTWMRGQPGFVGVANNDPTKCTSFHTPGFCPFVVKNLLEFKNAQRVLVEGNIFEHTWPGFTQHGAAVLFTAMSQGGTVGNPNATVADITFRYNRVSHAASGLVMGIVGVGNTGWSIPRFAGRFSVHDDIFDDLSPAYYNGDTTAVGLAFQMSQCATCTPLQNITINHVTMLLQSPRMLLIFGAGVATPVRGVTLTNTIASTPPGLAVTGTGSQGPCAFYGATDLARINSCTATSYNFLGNALIGASNTWPAGNTFPPSPLDVGFANYNNANGGDYHIISGPFRSAATDGRALGANVDGVNQAIAGVQ